MNRLRRIGAPVLLALLALAFCSAAVAGDCQDDCLPDCGDCALCPMAVLISSGPAAHSAPTTDLAFERLDASAANAVRRPVEHVPLVS